MNRKNLTQIIQLAGLLHGDYNSYGQVELYIELLRLSKQFTTLDTHACNGTKYADDVSYQVAVNKLHMKTVKLLEPYGLRYYHQSDPRGVALYVAKHELTQMNYSTGAIAIY